MSWNGNEAARQGRKQLLRSEACMIWISGRQRNRVLTTTLTSRPCSALIFAEFVEVNCHRFLHEIPVQSHFEIDEPVGGVSNGGAVRGHASVLNDLLPIQPSGDESVLLLRKSDYETEVKPASAHLALRRIESCLALIIPSSHKELSAGIPDRKNWIRRVAAYPFANLLPLRKDKPRIDDREILRQIKAEGILIGFVHPGPEPWRLA